jgi:hypothetical protein
VTAESDGVILDMAPQTKEVAMGVARRAYYYNQRAQRRNPPIRLSGKEHVGLWVFVVVVFWPFCLDIKGSTELTIALIWWGLLALAMIWSSKKRPSS